MRLTSQSKSKITWIVCHATIETWMVHGKRVPIEYMVKASSIFYIWNTPNDRSFLQLSQIERFTFSIEWRAKHTPAYGENNRRRDSEKLGDGKFSPEKTSTPRPIESRRPCQWRNDDSFLRSNKSQSAQWRKVSKDVYSTIRKSCKGSSSPRLFSYLKSVTWDHSDSRS